MRRVEKLDQRCGGSMKKEEVWIEALIAEFEKLGYLNDFKYAETKVRSLLVKGKSIREVTAWLPR